jgi:CheY-like chemotaxis protein
LAAEARPRVLLAEDNEVNQKVAALLLQKLGYSVDVVANGQEAVAALRRREYAAVLMDGQMPVLDGYQATRAVRAMEDGARHTPVIALTASVMPDDRERCLAAGMDDFIAKPVTPERLESVLRRWAPVPLMPAAPEPPTPPPAEQGASPPGPVDWDVLGELRAFMPPESVNDVLAEFVRDVRVALIDFEGARVRRELSSWRRLAHRIRGSCATLGARGMVDLTARMEALDDESLSSQGERLLADFDAEFRRVEQALSNEPRRA